MQEIAGKNHDSGRRITIVALVGFLCAFIFSISWLIDFKLSSKYPSGFYGWQTEAFVSRQLSLKILPNPALAKLSNPYDGSQNAPFRVLDASYYKGRYYSYFGVGPILFLTLPWRLLTNSYLTEPGATAILVTATFATGLALLLRLRNRAFIAASPIELVAGYLLVTIGSYSQIHLVGINAGTVAQTGAYFCFTGALYFVLRCLDGEKPLGSLATASLFCGLAVACRPSFALAFAVVVPPAYLEFRRRRCQILAVILWMLVPCAAIGMVLMYYNYSRFGSVWEFGNRYQLTNVDYRKVSLLSLGNLRKHLPGFVFSPFNFSHYFPFLVYRHDVEPVGFIWLCPASILALGLLSYFRNTVDSVRLQTGAFALSVGLGFAGVLLFLAAYLLFLFHYEIDFMVPWVWLVAIGWYGALSDPVISNGQRRIIGLAGSGLCLVSALIAILYTLSMIDFATRLPRLTATMNSIVSILDDAKGVSYGGIGLRVRFPHDAIPGKLPLLATGIDSNDLVYAEMLPNSRVRFGYFHAGLGGPISEPVNLDLLESHQVDIFMGSLLPPPAHPYFSGWSARAIFRAKKTFAIVLDGHKLLACLADFYDSSPGSVLIGKNPHLGDVAASRFTGDISQVHIVPFQPIPEVGTEMIGSGAVTIHLRFPSGRDNGTEPLVSTGVTGRGDLVYVTYLSNENVKFGLDHWGRAYESQPVWIDRTKQHLITVISSSLAHSGDAAEPFEILCDSQSILALSVKTYESDVEDVYFGINAIGSSVSGPMFSGTIFGATSTVPPQSTLLGAKTAAIQEGVVSMDVLFNSVEIGTREPLLVVGEAGKADFIYVTRLDSNHLKFGFDHWGSGGPLSEALEIDPGRWHVVQIFLGSLASLGGKQSIRENEYRVTFDDHSVLQGVAHLFRSTLDNVYIGANPVGGSTTGVLFSGRIRIKNSPP